MFITVVYLLGIIQHAWSFSWWHGLLTFIMDIIIAYVLKPDITVINKTEHSGAEEDFWKKKTQVEELNRVKLHREVWEKK